MQRISWYLLEQQGVAEARQAGIRDDHLVLIEEDVLGVEVFVNDPSCMEVAHRLGNLPGDVEALVDGERLHPDMDVLVEGVAFAEAGDDGKVGRNDACSHKQG